MANYKEILRLHSLGINNTRIAESCGCARSTVISALQRAESLGIAWKNIQGMSETEVSAKLYPRTAVSAKYKMPDYELVHREMQKSGVTLSLLWVEYLSSAARPFSSAPAAVGRRNMQRLLEALQEETGFKLFYR